MKPGSNAIATMRQNAPANITHSSHTSATRWCLLGILLIALFIRIAYLSEIAGQPDFVSPGVDAGFHQYWALAAVTGDWTPPPGAPDPELTSNPYVRPPGYPYLLTGLYALTGPSYLGPRLLNFALALLNCYLVFRIGRRWFSPAVGLVWMVGMASYWGLVYFEGELQAATLLITLLISVVYLLGRWLEGRRIGYALAAGLLLGLAAITRPNALPVIPAALMWMVWSCRRQPWRPTLISAATLAVASAAAIAPVTIRNYLVANDFVLISANAGVNLYIGNNPEAEGHAAGQVAGVGKFHSPYDYPNLAQSLARETGRPMKYSEVSAEFGRRALAFIGRQPGRFLALTLRRALLFWGPDEIANNKEVHYERAFSPILRHLPLNCPAVVALATLGGGLMIARRRGAAVTDVAPPEAAAAGVGGSVAALMVVIIVVMFLAVLPFFVAARYRIPLVPFLLFFAAWGICNLACHLRQRHWRTVTLAALVGGGAFVLASIPWAGQAPSLARWHLDRALAFGRVQRYAEALPHYEAALRLQPDAPMIRLSYAHALRRLENYADALATLAPNLAHVDAYTVETHVMIAEIRLQQGDRAAAIAHYQEALKREPHRGDLRRTCGWLLAMTGRFPEAIDELSRVIAEQPLDAEARMLLGMALYESGNHEAGRRQIHAAIAQNPALEGMARAVGVPLDGP